MSHIRIDPICGVAEDHAEPVLFSLTEYSSRSQAKQQVLLAGLIPATFSQWHLSHVHLSLLRDCSPRELGTAEVSFQPDRYRHGRESHMCQSGQTDN